MPTATPFTALGKGNGFASCLSKVDVSNYDYWTTLSGVNKNSPEASDSLIAESLELGMKIYWNLFSCVAPTNVTFSSTADPPLPSESSSVSNLDVSSHSNSEPMDRICGYAYATDSQSSNPSGRTNCQLFLTAGTGVRMYDGVTTDESNFVGIGYAGGEQRSALVNTFGLIEEVLSLQTRSRVTILGYADESTSTAGVFDYAYVTVSGLHFVCEASADGGSKSVNATNLTASASSTIEDNNYSSNSAITSLGFYTY